MIKHGTVKKKVLLAFASIFGFWFQVIAQPAGYFRNPLDIPIQLSANFGEIRTDHFHTGFDIRTQEKTGLKVYAAADGYISRIKVSATGYGKVLYITHPNGLMTVYGHLDRFNDRIAEFVKKEQYSRESFEIELFPDAISFTVKKGDLIAYSGNSGSSGGPHLHFEIRDASGETYPLNPSTYIAVEDTIAPVFSGLYLYPFNEVVQAPEVYSIKKSGNDFTLKEDSIIIIYPELGVGVEVKDFMNHTSFDYGIYEMSLTVDQKPESVVRFDRLDFNEGRYANAYVDYRKKKESGAIVQRLFKLPGDKSSIYHDVADKGIILLNDTFFHKITIRAKDSYGNSSEFTFFIKYRVPVRSHSETFSGKEFLYNKENDFVTDSIKLHFNSNTLYEDLDFEYSSENSPGVKYSAIHHVHNAFIPVHDYYSISILPRTIPFKLKSKAVIVYENEKGSRRSKTSRWEGDWLVAKAREFGDFYVMLDTTAPKISTGIKQGQRLVSDKIDFTISDNLSGIVSYKGLLDGQWFLMEYDPKNNSLSGLLDKGFTPGDHSIEITVTDDVKNVATYTLKFKK